jgi:hypothetical protein
MNTIASLFEKRGGWDVGNVCEVCFDPIPDDSVVPVCADCNTQEEDE